MPVGRRLPSRSCFVTSCAGAHHADVTAREVHASERHMTASPACASVSCGTVSSPAPHLTTQTGAPCTSVCTYVSLARKWRRTSISVCWRSFARSTSRFSDEMNQSNFSHQNGVRTCRMHVCTFIEATACAAFFSACLTTCSAAWPVLAVLTAAALRCV